MASNDQLAVIGSEPHIFVTASIEVPDRNAYLVPISQ
jgi:hypothetical protein